MYALMHFDEDDASLVLRKWNLWQNRRARYLSDTGENWEQKVNSNGKTPSDVSPTDLKFVSEPM